MRWCIYKSYKFHIFEPRNEPLKTQLVHLPKESLKKLAAYSMSEDGGVGERGTGRFDTTLGDPGNCRVCR